MRYGWKSEAAGCIRQYEHADVEQADLITLVGREGKVGGTFTRSDPAAYVLSEREAAGGDEIVFACVHDQTVVDVSL